MLSPFPLLWTIIVVSIADASTLPPIIPAVHSFKSSPRAGGDYELPAKLRIVVDAAHASSTADNGLTQIPPTVEAFSRTFATDLEELFPHTSAEVVVSQAAAPPQEGGVVITLFPDAEDLADFALANGHFTTEGYEMKVSRNGVVIKGSGAKGTFWATRTLLQGLLLRKGSFPSGIVRDQPDWLTRGFMLDVARQYYPIEFLKELCSYASWFKMSEFHVHLSDNAIRGGPSAYARLRLLSHNNPGLTPFANESYTQADFEDFQQHCAGRGVTVVPEFEAPGHALAISQWKPELARVDDPTLLNLSVPETTLAVESIWQEFLPGIHSKQVSIGADEYPSNLADDYNNFVNTLSDFIAQQSNKTTRLWGTFEPSNKTFVSKNIIKQHWSDRDDDGFALIRQGYKVLSSDDKFLYIVVKQPASLAFGNKLNQTQLWNGANSVTGGIWDPSIFDRSKSPHNATNNPMITEPFLQGAIMAAWNDHGRNASTYLEAYYSLKEGLPVVAAVNWQAASRPGHLTQAQFLAGFPNLEAHAPGENLSRRVHSKGAVVVSYDLARAKPGATVPDASGNGYAAVVGSDGVVRTPLGSKGHNYKFLIETRSGDLTPGTTLLSGPDDSFGVVESGSGTTTLAFMSTNVTWPLANYTLQSSTTGSLEIVVRGTEAGTTAFVNGQKAGDFGVVLERSRILVPMAFVAPAREIAAGIVTRFELLDGLQDVGESIGGKM